MDPEPDFIFQLVFVLMCNILESSVNEPSFGHYLSIWISMDPEMYLMFFQLDISKYYKHLSGCF